MKNLRKIIISLCAFLIVGICFYYFFIEGRAKRSLSILAWHGTFSSKTIRDFEKKTGITINLSHYATNEELIAKLILTKGEGIDLIVPSDYVVSYLYETELIMPLDKELIADLKVLYKKLVDPVIKEDILYAVPLEWGIYGIGVSPELDIFFENNNKKVIETFFFPQNFEKRLRLCMTNDSSTALTFAFHGALKSPQDEHYTQDDLKNVVRILKKQKPSVVVYSDNRIGHLFTTKEIDMAFMQSDEFLRVLPRIKGLRFYIPPRGTIKTVEYIAISSASKHSKESYEFINFILSKKIMEQNIKTICCLPSRQDLEDTSALPPEARFLFNLMHDNDHYTLYSVSDFFSESDRLKFWTSLKSS